MTPLEWMILAYAGLHNVDLDTAAYRVLADLMRSIDGVRSCAGLYDRMFGKQEAKK